MVAGWLPPPCPTGRGSCSDGEELFLGILQCGCERGTGEPGGRDGRKDGGEGKKVLGPVSAECILLGFHFLTAFFATYFLTTFLILTFLAWCSFPPFSDWKKPFQNVARSDRLNDWGVRSSASPVNLVASRAAPTTSPPFPCCNRTCPGLPWTPPCESLALAQRPCLWLSVRQPACGLSLCILHPKR